MSIKRRVLSLRGAFSDHKIDGFVLSSVPNVSYVSGFTGDDSIAVVTPCGQWIITDFRYVEQVEQECPGWKIVERKLDLWSAAAKVLKRQHVARLGFESANLSHRNHGLLKDDAKGIKLVPVVGLVEKLRQVKEPQEVAAIEAALDIQQRAFRRLCAWVKPGMTEARIARELEYLMGCAGADKPSFESIVAAAERGSLPHARPSERVVSKGDTLLIDWGARRFFYNSDLTRVLHFGKVTRKFERIYGIVKEAQARAIAAIRPGIMLGELDAVARDYISSKGFGDRFGHSLGHGIGLEVHELPGVRKGNRERVVPGMVFTIEPGIYIPGWGGVRIEDMVLVTDTGARVLSSCDSDLDRMLL